MPEYDESVIDPDKVREDHRLKFTFKCISVKLVGYGRIEITIKDIESSSILIIRTNDVFGPDSERDHTKTIIDVLSEN